MFDEQTLTSSSPHVKAICRRDDDCALARAPVRGRGAAVRQEPLRRRTERAAGIQFNSSKFLMSLAY